MTTKCPYCIKNISVNFKYYTSNKCPFCNKRGKKISRKYSNIRYLFRIIPLTVFLVLSLIVDDIGINFYIKELIIFLPSLGIAFVAEFIFYYIFRKYMFY